ncbi:MAG: hypothetical protein ABI193_15405, partial [Minicystis sp.]
AACGPPPVSVSTPRPAPTPLASAPHAAPASESPAAAAERARVAQMVVRVAAARGLPVLRPVAVGVLNRAQLLAKIRAHVEKEMPPETIVHEGEVLAALELVPDDYDFLEGSYKLIQGRIAGFYEPSDQTMYLADDLDDSEAEETLAHELVHALQDQSFSIAPMIRYRPGDGDRLAAAHALIEGDATSAMFDVVAGSAFNVSERMFAGLVAASTALSAEGAATPHLLQASLGAPYTDGFHFVQALRADGDWAAIDSALRALPTTTEQLLHPAKYAAREPAIPVAAPTIAPLGEGFRAVLDDVMGEQGLRLGFAEWTHRDEAERAAAGWGGDRYVVARRDLPGASPPHEVALGWRMIFDSAHDAGEAAAVLRARFGAGCKERPTLGPLAWKLDGRAVALAAGPFARTTPKPKSTGSCAVAQAWVTAMLKADPSAP